MRSSALFLFLVCFPAHAKKVAAPPPPAWKCGESVAEGYGSANTALNAGKFVEASTGFDTVLVAEPQCGLALLGSGRARLGAGQPTEAVAQLTAAAALFADRLEVQVWLGRARLVAGDDAGALGAAKAGIALKPGSVDAQRVAQDALLRLNDLTQARAMLEAARAAANVVTWDCLDGFLSVAESDVARANTMLKACEGVPDRTVYDALAAKVATLPPPAP